MPDRPTPRFARVGRKANITPGAGFSRVRNADIHTVESMRILVAGATGYVGSRLVTELLKDGHKVIAATRNPGRLAGFGWHDKITGVALDADDPTSVRAAFAAAGPVDIIYYLVHAIGQPGFRDRDNARRRQRRRSRERMPASAASCTSAGSYPTTTYCPITWPAAPRWPKR